MSDETRTQPPKQADETRTVGPDGATGSVEEAPAAPPGYELHSLLGEGGMGTVYLARDVALGRDVAVKILRARYGPGSASAARFLDEARITGQLQHPAIPPIHQVGTLPDGRPFLAMKLIKGRTLDELLKDQPAPAARPGGFLSPFEQTAHASLDRLDAYLRRGRLLAIFEQVAQALGYAHSRGVIHRDLKPSNVMVGAFGEVQVMDWGLAKHLGDERRGEPKPDADTIGTEIRSLRDPGEVTQAGSLLGTPAYMPPEQAIGAVDQIDQRSDVFGLGGILCAILTGAPPYIGADSESTRQLAARAKLEDAVARLDGCGAEPELVALAKGCLAAEKDDRPKDAGEVATAVAALRADAERRLRQAEMDRARSEVKAAEERKRRRVKFALAGSVLGLVAVAGLAAWWVDRERTQRRAEQEAERLREVAAGHARAADLRERRLAYERDVMDAVKEAEQYIRAGREKADDLNLWSVALGAATAPMQRAEKLLGAGGPDEELRRAFDAVAAEWKRDFRDRALLAELDRIADDNEIRLLIPVSFNSVTSRRFASAFRSHGIDLAVAPTAEVAAWLRGHRFRDRLVTAVRTWRRSLPFDELIPNYDFTIGRGMSASAAVAGLAAVYTAQHAPTLGARLDVALKEVTDAPFDRDWWDAIDRRDAAALRALTARPEFARLSSRELSALADGLQSGQGKTAEVLGELLSAAHDRFPGEFWVHFRLAMYIETVPAAGRTVKSRGMEDVVRHMTAAVAARPRSAIARSALAMTLLEERKDEEAALRMLRGAAEVDPASPWPHIFRGLVAMEKGDWVATSRAFRDGVRVDPDTGFFMLYSLVSLGGVGRGAESPSDRDLEAFIGELIAAQPDHPGGYDLLASHYLQRGDHRAALAAFRKARRHAAPNYPGRTMFDVQLAELELKAQWETRLPNVLAGRDEPADGREMLELAGYCATFEKKFALAVRFADAALRANPEFLEGWVDLTRFAGWAVQAGAGNGADAADLPPAERERLRRQALVWLREAAKRAEKQGTPPGFFLNTVRDLAPVRDAKELAKLPDGERAEWEKLWAEAGVPTREVAPPPREAKK